MPIAGTPALPRRRPRVPQQPLRWNGTNLLRYTGAAVSLGLALTLFGVGALDWHGLHPAWVHDGANHDRAFVWSSLALCVLGFGCCWPIQAAFRSVHPRR